MRLLEKMGVSSAASRDSGDMCRRTFGITVRAGSVDEKARTIDVVASTEAIDSYDEIVEQDWNLTRYLANPVVLYAHNAVGLCGPAEDTLPIGFASNVEVQNGEGGRQLVARLHFVDASATPMAEKVWQGFRQGSIRAVSVGFRPHSVREERRNDKIIGILSDNELYEISACPVPANPEAVARSAARNKAQVERMAKQQTQVAPAATEEKDEHPMKEELEKAKALQAKAEAELETVKAAGAAREAELQKAVSEAESTATEANKRADEAEAQVATLEVDALVGKKITPAEKDEFLELRKTNPELFAKMVAKRADLSSLTTDVVGDDPAPKNKASDTGGAAGRLANKARSKARS